MSISIHGIAAGVDNTQWPPGGELGERSRQPLARPAAIENLLHRFDQRCRAGFAELGDPDVLAVGLVVAEGLGDRRDAASARPHLHLLVGVDFVAARRHQQRVVVARRQEVDRASDRGKHIAVQHDEAVDKKVAREPQRVQAVGGVVAAR